MLKILFYKNGESIDIIVQYQVKYWDFIVFQILMLQFKVLHNIYITINQNVNNHRNIIILNSIYLKVSQIPMQLSFEFVWQAGFSIHNFYCYSAYVLHLFVLKSPENSNYNYTKITINLCMVLWEGIFKKWPEPGYGSNHSSLYSCTMPLKTKGEKWPNWV